MSAMHTPTPWTLAKVRDRKGNLHHIWRGATPKPESEWVATVFAEGPTAANYEDAAFIVKAANNHDVLVDAMARILKRATSHPDDTPEDRGRDLLHIEHYARQALASIDRATP